MTVIPDAYFVFQLLTPGEPAPKPGPEWPPVEPSPTPPVNDPIPTVPPVTGLQFHWYSQMLN
jgi:hypothetical protein